MRATCLLVPVLAVGAAACGGSTSSATSATVHLDASTAWSGTAEVLVHTPGGDLVSRTPLAAGDNDLPLDDGDTVTIAITDGTTRDLETAFAVQRGDVLYAQARPPWPDGYHDVTIDVPTVANVDSWMIEHPDGASYDQGGAPTTYVLPDRTSVPLLVGAIAADQSTLAVFGDAAAPIAGDAIDLSTHTPLDLATTQVAVTGAPAGATIDLGTDLWFGGEEVGVPVFPSTGAVVLPTGLGDVHAISVFASGTSSGVGVITAQTAPFGDHLDVDLGAVAVPDVTAAMFDGTQIAWGTSGGGDFDGYSGGIAYADGSSWYVLAPAGATSIDLPQMPADVLPTAAASSGNLIAFAYDDLDYDGFLAGPVAPSDGARWELRGSDVMIPGTTAAAAPARTRLEQAMRAVVARRR